MKVRTGLTKSKKTEFEVVIPIPIFPEISFSQTVSALKFWTELTVKVEGRIPPVHKQFPTEFEFSKMQ